MIIAMALMSGYRDDLRKKLVRGNAAVIIHPLLSSATGGSDERVQKLVGLEGVSQIRAVTYAQGTLQSQKHPGGLDVTLRGIDDFAGLEGLGRVSLHEDVEPVGRLRRAETLGLVAGDELARRLGATNGDVLTMLVLGFQGDRPRFTYKSVELMGTFATGFAEFDQSWAVTDRRELEAAVGRGFGGVMYEVAIDDADRADEIADRVRTELGGNYLVTSWLDLNRELFTALEVQQMALFLVLGLIVLVSTFNVASSLVVLVRERMKDIGVLAALGLAPSQLRSVFLLYGGGLGVVGGFAGVIVGSLIAWTITEFELIRFDPEMAAIYFISSVPFRVELGDVLAVLGFTLLVTLVSCWLPAQRAASIRPARALRYE
jgi:lipoprotein-releasing system permease protein